MSEKIKIEALELAKSHEINASYCRGENRLAEDSAKVLRSQHGEITRLTADRDALQARLDAMVPLTDEHLDRLVEPHAFGLAKHVNIYKLRDLVEIHHGIKGARS